MGKDLSFRNVKYGKKAERRNYSKMRYDIDLPDLIEVQTKSFNEFIDQGIAELLRDISPIVGQNGEMKLYFDAHSLEEPKMSIQEAKERDQTYAKTLRAQVKLESVREGQVRETEILLTELPMMTPTGTFIINGAERVVVSQIIRSAGAYFSEVPDKKTHRIKYEGQIIPTRGAWIEFETDSKEIPYVKIDRSRKLPVTTFMRALGLSKNKDIVNLFGKNKLIEKSFEEDRKNSITNSDDAVVSIYATIRQEYNAPVDEAREFLRLRLFEPRRYDLMPVGRYKLNQKLNLFSRLKLNTKSLKLFTAEDIFDYETGEIIVEEHTLLDDKTIELLKTKRESLRELIIPYEEAIENVDTDKVLVKSVDSTNNLYTNVAIHNFRTGELIIEENTLITEEVLEVLRFNKLNLDEDIVNYFLEGKSIYEKERLRKGVIIERIQVYIANNKDELLAGIENKKIEPINIIGNYQEEEKVYITLSDIFAAINYYFNLYDGIGLTDDIDHLGNRRLRLIGELLKNQFRIGLARTEKNIIDKMSTASFNGGTSRSVINSIINMSPLSGAIKTFFGSSQLSQFMDQVNPLAELTQKRRVSALGTGGIARDRAGVEVRDVHSTHYGRICPIETPEGPSIGLISSLATYAKVDQYGFIMTPYFKLDLKTKDEEGRTIPKVVNEIEYLTANEERAKVIASAATIVDTDGSFVERRIIGRNNDETRLFYRDQFTHMDVSPKQIVSVSTATIPFLEHDDATRALMGANMQRQAVPLIMPESPIVGTGVEYRAAKDSGAVIVSEISGIVTSVDAANITITQKPESTVKFGKKTIYEQDDEFTYEVAKQLEDLGLATSKNYDLMKFVRSNQDTFILQKPLVTAGEKINAGDIIADGAATKDGELALGRNVTVAFMTWDGYNYEDAIIMSEDLVKDDVYTSVHIDEYQTETRDIKSTTSSNQQEEITREVSQASNEALRKLDPEGIVIVGSEVKEGDILVGKITPKGVNDPSPTEKLIQSILGDKSKDYRDTSLKVPHGGGGIVQRIQYYSKKNGDKLPPGVNESVKVFVAQKRKITEGDKMAGRHGNKGVISKILPREDMPYMEDGTTIDILLNPLGVPSRMNIGQILEIHLGMAARSLGIKVATPVFDGVSDDELSEIMKEANIDLDGKTTLYDGRTGEAFDSRISVGVMYMIKLSHMVDDKLHARADGPYTLVTQQPMGGKAQNGGQRFGEMEVWALYAYGAAHTLQELLTVKSDDMLGRNAVYSAITQGKKIPKPSIPESFRVFTRELQSLGLYVELVDNETGENEAMKPIFNTNTRRGGNR